MLEGEVDAKLAFSGDERNLVITFLYRYPTEVLWKYIILNEIWVQY